MIKQNNTLSGYVVGLGKVRADGSVEYRELDEPIKNTIVKQGLNKWFTHNGSNSAIVQSADGDSKDLPTSAIRAMCYGTSGNPTDFATTTDLISKSMPTPYETIYSMRSWPYKGTRNDPNNDKVVNYRWTTESNAAPININIREIGVYKKENSDYYLFARIVLPSSFELQAGEKFICTYQLSVSFPHRGDNVYRHLAPGVFFDAAGHDLQPETTQEVIVNNSSDNYFCNAITNVQTGSDNTRPFSTSNTPIAWGPYCRLSADGTGYYGAKDTVFYKESQVNYPAINAAFPTGYSLDTGAAHPVFNILNYTPDTFERKIFVRLPHLWPNMQYETDYKDIWYLNFRCLAVRFGYMDNGVWTPAAWRKKGNEDVYFTLVNSFKTQEAIDWLAGQ